MIVRDPFAPSGQFVHDGSESLEHVIVVEADDAQAESEQDRISLLILLTAV